MTPYFGVEVLVGHGAALHETSPLPPDPGGSDITPASSPDSGIESPEYGRMWGMNFLIRLIVNAVAIFVAAWILPDMSLAASSSMVELLGPTGAAIAAYAVVGLVFGLVNAIVRPVVRLLSLPLTCLTLGLFGIIVNALMLSLTAWLSEFLPFTLSIDDFFFTTIFATIIISIASLLANVLLPEEHEVH